MKIKLEPSELDLYDQEIEHADSKIYENIDLLFSNLTRISFRLNRIKNLDSNVFQDLIHLEEIDLQYNFLNCLDVANIFKGLANLKHINL